MPTFSSMCCAPWLGNVGERAFKLHDFVIMPDHLHLLFTIDDGMTVEKAMQLLKGRSSFRLGRELGFKGEEWQKGFSELQVLGERSLAEHRAYIANNPVKAGLVDAPEKYAYCFESLAREKAATQRALAATEA
jgi:putative transposase